MDGPVDGEGTGEKEAKIAAEVDGIAAFVSVTALVEGSAKVVTAIAEGALEKEGVAESEGMVEGVRTVDSKESESLEAPLGELAVVAFCAAADPKKTKASEGM